MKARVLVDVLLVVLVLVVAAAWLTDASEDYTTMKPMVAVLYPKANTAKIVSAGPFGYNSKTSQYPNVTVSVLNTGLGDLACTVEVLVFNATSYIVASGNKELVIKPNVTAHLIIELAWQQGKTIADYAMAKVTVTT